MNLPGFTAEVSLLRSSENFKTDGLKVSGVGAQAVIPQLCWTVGPCIPIIKKRLRCCVSFPSGVSCKLVGC